MEQTISSDFIRGHIDTIILRSLFSGSKHAFEIAAFIEEKSGNKYEVKQATLYSALKRLEKLKYVKPFWNDAPGGGRRRYFEMTPAGKAFADKNLSEWDYSRDVIDQLVDEVPKNLVHESGVVLSGKSDEIKKREKAAETTAEISPQPQKISEIQDKSESEERRTFVYIRNDVNESQNQTQISVRENTVNNTSSEKTEKIDHREEAVRDPALERILNSSQNEINYREFLNSLYEKNAKKHSENGLEKEQIIPSDPIPQEKQPEEKREYGFYEAPKPDIPHESVFDKDFRIKTRNTGKTDFTDLIEKADAEGYKIRISTGKSEKISGKILITKINLCSSLAFFLIFLIECLACSLIYKNNNLFSGWVYFGAIAVAALLPITQIIAYVKYPNKTLSVFNKNLIYTVLIILFNVLLIIVAIALLTNTDFTDKADLAKKIILPMLVVLDIFLYFAFRNICANMRSFITK